jgi:hypothetical protein
MWNIKKRTVQFEPCIRHAQINENLIWKWKVNENQLRGWYYKIKRANCWLICNKFKRLRKLKESARWYEILEWRMHKVNQYKKWRNWKFDGSNG